MDTLVNAFCEVFRTLTSYERSRLIICRRLFAVALEMSAEMSRAGTYYNTLIDIRLILQSTAIAIMSDYHLYVRLSYKPYQSLHLACLGGCSDVIKHVHMHPHASPELSFDLYNSDVLVLLASLDKSYQYGIMNTVHARADITLLWRITAIIDKCTSFNLHDINRVAHYGNTSKVPQQQLINYFSAVVAMQDEPFRNKQNGFTSDDVNLGYATVGDIVNFDNRVYQFAWLHTAYKHNRGDIIDAIIRRHAPMLSPTQEQSLCLAAIDSGNLQRAQQHTILPAQALSLLSQNSLIGSNMCMWLLDQINIVENYSALLRMAAYAPLTLWQVLVPRLLSVSISPDDHAYIHNTSLYNTKSIEHAHAIIDQSPNLLRDHYASADITLWLNDNPSADEIIGAFGRNYRKTIAATRACNRGFVIDERLHRECLRAAKRAGVHVQ